MMDKNHIDVELLAAFVRGELSASERKRIVKLSKSDESVKDMIMLLEELEEQQHPFQGERLEDSVAKISSSLMREYIRAGREKKYELGVMVFDSGVLPLPEGIRPASVETRRVTYRLGDRQIYLSFYPISPESFEMMGQLDSPDNKDRGDDRVTMKIRGSGELTTTTDNFGFFRFKRIPKGRCVLTIETEGMEKGRIEVEL